MKKANDYQMELLDIAISTLKESRKKEHIQNILMDAVIFDRISSGMDLIVNAYGPTSEGWEPENEYSGVYNALNALGLYSPPDFETEKIYLSITDTLIEIFREIFKRDMEGLKEKDLPDHSKKTAEDLAKQILLEWEIFVNKVRFGRLTLNP